MTLNLTVDNTYIPHTHKHSHSTKKNTDIDQYLNVAQVVSAIAVVAFALYVDPALFAASFVFGVFVGAYQSFRRAEGDRCSTEGASCSQGVFEQLSGVKLPKIIELIASVAVVLCHIDHHPTVFIPISGLYFGARLGKAISPYVGKLES